MTCSLTLGASTGKPPAHGSWRPPPAPPAPGAVVKEVVRAVSLGQESQQCWVVRTRRFFMGVNGAQQWKAESPIATRPCKAHPGLNQGAGSWYPRGAPHSPSSLKPPPDSAVPEIFPVQKASVFISCPAACPSPVFLYQILDQDPILVGPHPYCPMTVISGEILMPGQELAVPFPSAKADPNTHRQNPPAPHCCADLQQTPTFSPSLLPPGPRGAFYLSGLRGSEGWASVGTQSSSRRTGEKLPSGQTQPDPRAPAP